MSQFEKALPDVNRALELDPKLAEAYDTRAHIYWAMARDPNLLDPTRLSELTRYATSALSDYHEALRLKPGLEESIQGLAEMGVVFLEKK